MDTNTESFWKKCSTCKKPIQFSQKYYVCSVSTCNGQRTGYSFCSMTCFEAHLPGARHRDAGAIEKIAPKNAEAAAAMAGGDPTSSSAAGGPRRIIASQQPTNVATYASAQPQIPHETLIVASKLKDYIRARSEMNTSASVMDILSDIVRIECDRAIDNARREGRKTVLDRDFKK
jgi:hypothetical protein